MLNKDRFSNVETIDENTRAIRDKELKSRQKKKKYLLMIISFIIAVAMWMYVVNDENPVIKQNFYDVEIEFLNKGALEKKGLVMTDADSETVRVTLEGKRSKIRNIKSTDIVAYVDVSQYEAGENYVNVNVNVPYSTELTAVNPSQIKLKIEKISTTEMDIKVSFKGNVEDGYEPHASQLSTDKSTISGASSITSKVSYLSAVVDASTLTTEASTENVKLVPVDKNGKKVSGVNVDSETVDVTAVLYRSKSAPLIVTTTGQPAGGYILSSFEAPSSVLISGPEDEVNNITSIVALPVNINGISASKEYDLKVNLPGNVILAEKQTTLKGKANISKAAVSSKKFTYEAASVRLESVPEGMSALVSGSVELTVAGTDEQLQNVSAADFTLSADCSQLSEGKHSVKIKVDISENAQSQGVKTDTPSVEIKIQADESE